ncbi:protein of unknown function [Shewanella benthica]|uniref:Uncharacterized protein n=1 Tax=Shewanella benthica TaxID=43661 RepID=A0A330M1Y0_9GAMM|nr:protein of unknown function [Shewanella benthica]
MSIELNTINLKTLFKAQTYRSNPRQRLTFPCVTCNQAIQIKYTYNAPLQIKCTI